MKSDINHKQTTDNQYQDIKYKRIDELIIAINLIMKKINNNSFNENDYNHIINIFKVNNILIKSSQLIYYVMNFFFFLFLFSMFIVLLPFALYSLYCSYFVIDWPLFLGAVAYFWLIIWFGSYNEEYLDKLTHGKNKYFFYGIHENFNSSFLFLKFFANSKSEFIDVYPTEIEDVFDLPECPRRDGTDGDTFSLDAIYLTIRLTNFDY